jgi:hypothetical protein
VVSQRKGSMVDLFLRQSLDSVYRSWAYPFYTSERRKSRTQDLKESGGLPGEEEPEH